MFVGVDHAIYEIAGSSLSIQRNLVAPPNGRLLQYEPRVESEMVEHTM